MVCGGALLAFLLSMNASAELPPEPEGEVEVSDNTRENFKVGVALLQDPDGARYEEAYQALMKAYRESPSWKILGNLGLCAFKLERYTDGIEAYTRYLKHADEELSAADREQFERDLRIMRATSGSVRLELTGGAEVSVRDTRARSVGGPLMNKYSVPEDGILEIVVAAGEHTFVATSGGKRAELKVQVDAGAAINESLVLKEKAEASVPVAPPKTEEPATSGEAHSRDESGGNLTTAGYITAGTGAALLIAGGVTTVLGLSKKKSVDEACPGGVCEYATPTEKSEFESDQSALKSFGMMSTVFFAAGGVLAAAGVTLVVLDGSSSDQRARLELSPTIAPGFSGFSAKGEF